MGVKTEKWKPKNLPAVVVKKPKPKRKQPAKKRSS